MNAPSTSTSKLALPGLLGIAAALYAAFAFGSGFRVAGYTYYCLFDDAMISMRYARHLAQGLGFVWNPGEAPIEGFTNLLWTLLMAAAHGLPLHDSHTSLAVMLLGAAILLANSAVVWRLADAAAGGSAFVKIAATMLTLFSYPLMFWTLRGMEVGLLALLVSAMALLTIRIQQNPRRPGGAMIALHICMALALLTRPDGLLPVVAAAWFAGRALPAGRARWRGALLSAGVIGGVAGGLTLWRMAYFGDWLPNTYYLKMTGIPLALRLGRGVETFAHLLLIHFWLPVGIVAIYTTLRLARRNCPPALQVLTAISALMCAYSIYAGGDAWENFNFANRYIALALPLLFVACAMAIEGLIGMMSAARNGRIGPGYKWAALGIILATQNFMPYYSWLQHGYQQKDEQEAMTRLGLLVRAGTSPDSVIAVTWAGAVPYFSQRTTIDLLGKNDREIARMPAAPGYFLPGHTKWDYDHSLGAGRADVIVQMFHSTAEDYRKLSQLGYVFLPSTMHVRPENPDVDKATLSADWFSPDEVDAALAAAPYPWR